jgi:CheY-like chemotaxis protein/MinD-like ATPase involved in chromosome partitioning or flagellar assembly
MADKILIVDDDVDSLKLIGLMLQRHGYTVVAANSGKQALIKADSERPELIILDWMMPDLSGIDVLKQLKGNANTKDIPTIMFTAKTLIDDKVVAFEGGADDYLTKPTHPAELASRVRAILARSEAQQRTKKSTRGLAIGVLGTKGGVGTTSLAVNLASALLNDEQSQPIVADFRLGVGTLGLLLGFGRSQGMSQVLQQSANAITADSIEGHLIQHQTGLRALVSSVRPLEAQQTFEVDSALATINVLRELGRPAFFDLGYGYDPVTARLQKEMDKLIVIVEPNSAALTMARELIQEVSQTGGDGRINLVVVNRSQSSLQTPWQQVEDVVGLDIKAIIAAAPELAFQATESGMPMVLLQPGAVVSGQMVKLAKDVKTRIKSLA